MPLDFTNTNLLWTSILAETLYRLGLQTAVICPGSRSAPLAIAFANHPAIEAIPVLDERSASFFALGLARQQKCPVVLVCTSGTAGANFYPAVIEARESRVPLLILTADRPPELRDCNAGQAIDQHKLYGNFPNWQTELALPSLQASLLAYLRQTLLYAWERTVSPIPGAVHLNLPFRDPLAPLPEAQTQAQALTFDEKDFFAFLASSRPLTPLPSLVPTSLPLATWQATTHGIIIAGPAQPAAPAAYCQAIAALSQALGFPVLAEGLSPVRNYADQVPHLIATYDLILRNGILAEKLAPEVVIRIGEMPTSKQLRTWLSKTQPRQWIIDPGDRNLDPLHGKTTHLPLAIETLAAWLPHEAAGVSPYLKLWQQAEAQTQQEVDCTMQATTGLFEGKVAWLLSQVLPPTTPLFICSSTPVRDVEFFWRSGNLRIQPYFNRGANGIDGSLSTALGMAHRQPAAVMLTGDLALLHDTNGFLLRQHFSGHLTIVLINNNGGGIFEMLPIAQFDPPFEAFFGTPQNIDFAHLCQTYGVAHELILTWEGLAERLTTLPSTGMRVLELRTDRKADARSRQNNLGQFAANIAIHPYAP
ncbi:MAG: 2-succinyl-5-enolpyruvyl-6-hydroxy-3-cyclohexene-1-carboxylic-acid synthase [Leptolyngbyaceae cyanobacterium bins.349]|nr:2-succinyl-5-enolpyruvyl-6-hydroxy-3-cyclohexene-1-carboxylic-acid synthase [Leptolyngbyaceae cyanobacterium bins.349]